MWETLTLAVVAEDDVDLLCSRDIKHGLLLARDAGNRLEQVDSKLGEDLSLVRGVPGFSLIEKPADVVAVDLRHALKYLSPGGGAGISRSVASA